MPGMNLRCPSCGAGYRAPDVEPAPAPAAASADVAPPDEADRPVEPDPPAAPAGGGVQVVHATAVRAPQVARPRVQADDDAAAASSGDPDDGAGAPPAPAPSPEPATRTRAQQLGRRGGLARTVYDRRRRA